MAIINNLRVILAEKKTNMLQLSEATDIHYTTINRFAKDDQKLISKEIMDKICDELGIQPGEIFIHVPDKKDGD